ncbi:hypothetical protein FPCIR_12709 [Fusarium pseudocircinatum]|uniref:Uncharacterized protein n=1 Tax=Fusarium pseudocircinatum TaxID=56676 RepID=A0A8H5KLS1_9HYPO|nr:hypothetical protein FPCIR_12709 [Fusarium pseudocircinatum]
MVATALSKKRAEEIQEAVGDPSTMSPDEYSAKLKEETGCDEILEQFLEQACKLDRERMHYPADEWLKRLTTMDFRNAAAISKHHFALTLYMVRRFDLGTYGEDTFAVKTDPCALLTQEATFPPLSPSADIESGDYHAHPSLISLKNGDVAPSHPDPEPSKTDTVTASGKSLPSLVMPIGQLQKKSIEEDDDDYVDTDYFLTIDATKINHPVWLIYDRNPRHDLGERHIVDPDKEPLVFKELGKNFDAMQVFPSLQWWLTHYEKPDFAHMLKVMQATGITGPIQAKELALSEADKLVSK